MWASDDAASGIQISVALRRLHLKRDLLQQYQELAEVLEANPPLSCISRKTVPPCKLVFQRYANCRLNIEEEQK